jgi:(1->4)-alpha-D-glucan 1-alpha-D-glucosylmutase
MRIPCSTYRLQFNSDFGFQKARTIAQYLSELGITDLYASPIFSAHKGSVHGYDVTDPTSINPEVGSEEELRSLASELKTYSMGWLQDIVPNHMAFSGENGFLRDVFENGRHSEYYDFFDIEWDHAYESMKGRLLAPFLGKSYAESLEGKEIKVGYSRDGFEVHYYSLQFPLRMESYPRILTPHLNDLKEILGPDNTDFIKFVGIIYTLKAFPCQELSTERYDQIRFAKRILWELYRDNKEIKRFIDYNLDELNGDGDSTDKTPLDTLLFNQFYRLSFWKVASEEINYRRFFSINELISLRMEDPEVFRRCHALILQLIKDGTFTGLRIDHIDGLYNPLNYLERLQKSTDSSYVTVEKILALEESLPSNWPVQGTSGYDYMNYLNGIFAQLANREEMDTIYTDFLGTGMDYENLIYEKKGIIIERFMMGDVDNLAHLMKRISSRDRGGGDITLYGLKRAITEVLACFPVYRTYICADSFTDMDRRYMTEALERARKQNPDLRYELDYLAKYLMLEYGDYLRESEKKDWLHFLMRFQQFTGPLMAKGFEDTTLYVYNRLISLNEVGGEPYSFGISLDTFHEFNRQRMEQWPHAMSASSTHDTKRGEDVRARINVLSEIPGEWEENVNGWRELNRRKKRRVAGMEIPSRNDEYFLYQTLVGAYPFDEAELAGFAERIKEYTIKAIREAKVRTGWIEPDSRYEEGCTAFVDAILDSSEENPFLHEFLPFQKKIAHYGMLNSLSQLLIKITSPGVPDFYQGAELWELSLVDPDNRRPVDYERRKAYLKTILQQRDTEISELLEDLMTTAKDGKIKMFLTHKALLARKQYRDVFEKGAYLPLEVDGRWEEHVVAFARNEGKSWAITVAPRFMTPLVDEGQFPLGSAIWQDTQIVLPGNIPTRWRNALTGREVKYGGSSISVGEALDGFPVALLVSTEGR